jgi:hypothetical protein
MISNIEKRREYARKWAKEWRENNPDKLKDITKSEKNKLRQARYREKHKEEIASKRKAHWQKYYLKNRDKQIARVAKYRKENPDKVRLKVRNWYKNGGMRKGTNARLALDIRRRINTALKKNYKASSTELLLGITISELKLYLESQFKEGMTWENHTYTGWHIDHIIPVSSFDLSKEEEQKKAFHYTNLQPLFAKENMKKSNRIII